MFDIHYGDIELTTLVLGLSVVILFPLQLLLCFKIRSLFLRLLPVIILFLSAAALLLAGFYAPGWDGMGYILLAILVCFMICACGISWVFWAIICKIRKKP